jgi:leucyl aminopeptidase
LALQAAARGGEDSFSMNLGGNSPTPLWLLYEDEIDAWRSALAPLARQWLIEQNFKAEKHRVLLLPTSDGGVACAAAGLGKRLGALSLWHAAGLVERLPARRFRFAQEFGASEATQLALGFAYGAYRFERYRSSKNETASLDPPANADMEYVVRAAESLRMARDWINTPAGDFGPSQLAAAARQVADRHQAAFKEWVGLDLLSANFPAIHAVGRASSEAPRLVELRWIPRGGDAYPSVTLIGKGVCFDSGGLDIKTTWGAPR